MAARPNREGSNGKWLQALVSGRLHSSHPDPKTPQLRELHVDAHIRTRPEPLPPETGPVIGVHGTPRKQSGKPVVSHHVNGLAKNNGAMNNSPSMKPLRRKKRYQYTETFVDASCEYTRQGRCMKMRSKGSTSGVGLEPR
ncbi:hypothetical protein VNO77_44742 [Canavalia gladiata]|uniref:Uncharacterized protein n=1 Tax=Canavalia gladiata TaxID=3824 RepID=A0AAN9PP18_CANGL